MPFNYSPTDSGRTRAGNEYAIPTYYTNNESIVNEGKRLYGIFCSHCHATPLGSDATSEGILTMTQHQ